MFSINHVIHEMALKSAREYVTLHPRPLGINYFCQSSHPRELPNEFQRPNAVVELGYSMKLAT